MAKRGLTKKQLRFIDEYLRCDNTAEAYRIAYPGSKNWTVNALNVNAHRNLKKPNIDLRIKEIKKEAQKKVARKYHVTLDRLTREYARVAFLDMRIFFYGNGNLIPVHKLDDDAAAVLAGLETVMAGAGEEVQFVKKIKTYDKLKALGDLGKHLGFFKEDNDQRGLHVVVLHDPGQEESDGDS